MELNTSKFNFKPGNPVSHWMQFMWELPQNLLGIALLRIMQGKIISKEKNRCRLFIQVSGFAISLGYYVFWSAYERDGRIHDQKIHEYGHALQSQMLGPLYLLIVGIPSLLRNLYGRFYFRWHRLGWQGYHKGFPEKWANILGNRYFDG